jgi:sugar/nucleoside kinase (ribokinase family)
MTTYKLAGIGNAVVDVISNADDSFLDLMGIEKGIMQLIEQDRGEVLYAAMTDRLQTPGGSVANTVAGVGALGLPTAFIGRVRDDALGKSYIDGMQKDGTDFVNAPVEGGDLPTSRSMIFVSPDGERSRGRTRECRQRGRDHFPRRLFVRQRPRQRSVFAGLAPVSGCGR